MAVRRSRAPIFAALALVVTGCSGDPAGPEPAAQADAGSAVPASPSGDDAAEEFIRLWAELEKDMRNTGETEEYAAITGPCGPCGRLVEQVRGYYAAGGHVSTDGVDITSITASGDGVYEVELTTGSVIEKRSAKAAPRRIPAAEGTYLLTLEPAGEGFVLAGLARRK